MPAGGTAKMARHDVFDVVVPRVLQKLRLGRLVDDHRPPPHAPLQFVVFLAAAARPIDRILLLVDLQLGSRRRDRIDAERTR